MNVISKRERIRRLLDAGHDPHDVTVMVSCALSYVYDVIRGQPHGRAAPVVATRMTLTGWHRDRHGNLTRELRGT